MKVKLYKWIFQFSEKRLQSATQHVNIEILVILFILKQIESIIKLQMENFKPFVHFFYYDQFDVSAFVLQQYCRLFDRCHQHPGLWLLWLL